MKNKLLPALTLSFFLAFQTTGHSQVLPLPNLGVASDYALFTSVGAFNITGGALITGNIGTNAGAFNGIPPGTLLGTINVANAASLQAAADVCAAYSDLLGRICGNPIGIAIGNGQTLTPGVHCSGAASAISGILNLDGGGDPNAIFIIQVNGALSTTALSEVLLINSASINNVFWQVNGTFTLAANSIFRGTVITSAGAISLIGTSSLLGRGLACNGAINVEANLVTKPTPLVLPVTLVNFSASRQGNSALLKWSTASEQNSKNFMVQRSNSSAANNWTTIAMLLAAGNSGSITEYSLIDKKMSKGNNFYRLRSTDVDGNYTLSNVKLVYFNETFSSAIRVFPNPIQNHFTVTGAPQGSTIILADMTGNILKKQQATGNELDEMEIKHLETGVYILKIVTVDGKSSTLKLNKQ